MRRAVFVLSTFAVLMFSVAQLAVAQWKANHVTNQTDESLYVIHSTWRPTKEDIPNGFRTRGYYRLLPGETRQFYAWSANSIYFRIWRSGEAIKPSVDKVTFSFWVHPSRSFMIVSDELSAGVKLSDLGYVDRSREGFVREDGFMKYSNSSVVNITSSWVSVVPDAPDAGVVDPPGAGDGVGTGVTPPATPLIATAQNYYPADIGNTWILENNFAQKTTYTFEGPEMINGEEHILLKIKTEKPSARTETDQYFLTVDREAIKLHRIILENALATLPSMDLLTLTADFREPATFFPRQLVLGDKWQIQTTAELMIMGPVESITDLEVVGFEDVITPVGTFENCAKIRLDMKLVKERFTSSSSIYQWFALEVGPVQYKNSDGLFTLTSYNLLTPPEVPDTTEEETMVLIPAGEFRMGSNDAEARADEQPIHTVYVDAFYMDTHEVTNLDFKLFVLANPQWQKSRIPHNLHDGSYLKHWGSSNNYPAGKANHPVVYVSWYAAVAYAKWAGKRLPTEAEWEKAARGGKSGLKYPWGNTISSTQANYDRSVGGTQTAGGAYPANGYGLYDMAGNVWEWCLDAYDGNFYFSSPARNPLSDVNTLSNVDLILDNYTQVNSSRVVRGGSWADTAQLVRVASRLSSSPTNSYYDLGFRCARSVSP